MDIRPSMLAKNFSQRLAPPMAQWSASIGSVDECVLPKNWYPTVPKPTGVKEAGPLGGPKNWLVGAEASASASLSAVGLEGWLTISRLAGLLVIFLPKELLIWTV